MGYDDNGNLPDFEPASPPAMPFELNQGMWPFYMRLRAAPLPRPVVSVPFRSTSGWGFPILRTPSAKNLVSVQQVL
jgi:hypothetical protein